jgi:vancomycin resistance protein YoaR
VGADAEKPPADTPDQNEVLAKLQAQASIEAAAGQAYREPEPRSDKSAMPQPLLPPRRAARSNLEHWVEAVQVATQQAVEAATQRAVEAATQTAVETATRAALEATQAAPGMPAGTPGTPPPRRRRPSEPMPNPFKEGPGPFFRWVWRFAQRATNHRWLLAGSALGIVLIGVYLITAASLADKIPKGTTVAGVEIGGLSRAEAIETLDFSLASSAEARTRVVVGDQETWISPKAAGLTFSSSDTVRKVTGFTLSPGRMWLHLSGGGELAPAVLTEAGTVATYLSAVGQQTEIRATDGTISVAAAQVVVTEPSDGLQLDVDAAVQVVRNSFLVAEQPWALPTKVVKPSIGQAAVDQAVAEIAEPLLSGPVVWEQGGKTVELSVGKLAGWAQVVENPAKAGTLTLSWDERELQAAVEENFPELAESGAAQASFIFEGDSPVIDDGQAGIMLDIDSLVPAMTQAATSSGDARRIALPLLDVDPAVGRATLESLGIAEPVAYYELSGAEPQDGLDAVEAAIGQLNGQLVLPEQTFSLTQTLGAVSPKLDGLATALFNAAFEAGMGDLDHTPHATYVARFGMGREASLVAGGDVGFHNDTPSGVLINVGMTEDHKIWAKLWSTKYWTVEGEVGEPGSHIAARTIESSGPACVPQPDGSAGFEIDYSRTRTDIYGSSPGQETWSWRYAPTNRVACA